MHPGPVSAVHTKKKGHLNLLRFCLVCHLFLKNKLPDVRTQVLRTLALWEKAILGGDCATPHAFAQGSQEIT